MNYRKILLVGGAAATIILPITPSMAQSHFARENSANAALYLRIPFSGSQKYSRTLPFEYGLTVDLKQNYNNFYSDTFHSRYRLRGMDIKFSNLGFESMSMAGQRLNFGAYKLRQNADENDGISTSTGLILGAVGLAIIGIVALSGGDDEPDACIAIFPKPPGCS